MPSRSRPPPSLKDPRARSSPDTTGPIASTTATTPAANDTKIVMWDCNGSAAQNWTIEADGTIQINGKCMDIYRDEKKNKAPVELWTCTGGANQQWQARNGTLVNPVSGKCLDDPRFNTADGTQLRDLHLQRRPQPAVETALSRMIRHYGSS